MRYGSVRDSLCTHVCVCALAPYRVCRLCCLPLLLQVGERRSIAAIKSGERVGGLPLQSRYGYNSGWRYANMPE